MIYDRAWPERSRFRTANCSKKGMCMLLDKAILNAIITAEICLPSEDMLHTQHTSREDLWSNLGSRGTIKNLLTNDSIGVDIQGIDPYYICKRIDRYPFLDK